MSAAAKGAGLERRAIAVLESQGWTVYRAGKVLKRIPGKEPGTFRHLSAQHDIFGAFDLIAIKPTEPIRLIQVSTKTQGWDKRKQVAPVLPKLPLEHCDAEIWLFVGGRRESGGQRFRVLAWNGFEWADGDAQPCPAASQRPSARTGSSPTQPQTEPQPEERSARHP